MWAALGLSQEYTLAEFEHDDESYGQTLYGVLRAYFPEEDPLALLQKAAVDPGMVSARVQNNYGDER